MNSKTLACIALLALAGGLQAVKVKQVEKASLADFQKGSFVNVSVDSNGRLSLGPRLKSLPGPAEEFYLSAAAAANGDLFLGTGHKAAVYRISAAGKSEKVFQGEQLDVYALLVAGNGDLIVGTSPNGRVYRIGKDNKASELFHPDQKFIWDLAEDQQGNIICALGNTGAVASISKAGSAESLLTAEDAHIICLHVTKDNAILAGSGDRGVLYEIRNRKVRVLFDSPLEEIKDIAGDDEGNVYFAAVKSVPAPQSSKEIEIGSVFPRVESAEREPIREKSILYCLRSDGAVETLWSSTEELVYAVHFDPQTKAVVIGTGNAGRVYRVELSGAVAQLCESDSAQVFRITGGAAPGKGYFLVANNAAGVTLVEGGLNASGTYYSEVFDARIRSRFGRLSWNADAGKQSTVSFAVRLGNSDYPDRSWTSWSAPFTDPENSNVNTGGYRFLQVKIVLSSANPSETPLLSGYRIHYLTDNLKPEVGPILVQTPDQRKPLPDTKPPAKYLHLSWEAADANQDRLNFNLFLRKLPGGEWLPLRSQVREKWLYLDRELFADGRYLLKVQADDGLDNAPAWAKTASWTSSPFVIDSTAPVLSAFMVEGRSVRFTVSDEASAVTLVQYSLDGKEWLPVLPDDLVGDSLVETFRFDLANPKNSRTLFIKVSDEYDNYKVFQKSI
ncbi:MAG: hypothetical protein MUC72_02720 [Acidobacteria bacterium]|jgi:hypothetical protein|nr:hypothetical protein [Acidobacteriota bacterium]